MNLSLCRRAIFPLVASIAITAIHLAAAEPPASPAAVLQDLRSFNTVATILHIGAHPDDENTQLIAYFARGRGYRTAYLSVTRGDGGQNEIGPEFDEKLGLMRTEELLAARKIDGGRQFFTRAIDFGYSKNPEETLRIWDRDQVLGDVVRVIRTFRPDVIVTRFPIPPGSGGHGHHTASAILANEAFKLSGDPKAYPEQLTKGLKPWQAKRIVWNGTGQGISGPTVTVDIGGADPVTRESFSAMAGRSRAMHKTQGFGNFGGGGGRGGGGPSPQTFTLLAGEPAQRDLMDGVDTTWNRFPAGAEVAQLADKAISNFDTNQLSANVPALLAIRAQLSKLPSDSIIDEKRSQLDRILQDCLGLSVATSSAGAEVVPGEKANFHLSAALTSDVPVKWVESRLRSPRVSIASGTAMKPGQPATNGLAFIVPLDTPLTQPYWLLEEGGNGIYHVNDPTLIGMPENPPSFRVDYVFEVGGQTLILPDEPLANFKSPKGEHARQVDVIPPVSLAFSSEVSLFPPGGTRKVMVEVTAARPDSSGSLSLGLPDGWKCSPASQNFHLAKIGDKTALAFDVTAPANPTAGRMSATAEVNGHKYANGRIEIDYPHIPFLLLQPKTEARLVDVDCLVRGKSVGFLPGAGDNTVEALEQLGYQVTTLTGADLTPEKLKSLDAIVIGVRAFNERTDLARAESGLFAYVSNGGTVIAQYNRPGQNLPPLGPYQLSIQGQAPQLRVTDEDAPVTFLAPENPVLNSPNKIGPADFTGWFQERGAYFASSWDREHYTPILAMSDPGEAPLQGSLLVAKFGQGYYVYTSLAFFRELPKGVPGAYRLFANLVSLGK